MISFFYFQASYRTPERMYKLVLAGDAAVGKSSFILRLCKNKFHSSLNATLGKQKVTQCCPEYLGQSQLFLKHHETRLLLISIHH